MGVFQGRSGDDGEAVVVCFGALVAFLQAAPIPCTRKGVVLGVLPELCRGHLERVGIADNALAGRRCESKVEVSNGAGCRTDGFNGCLMTQRDE